MAAGVTESLPNLKTSAVEKMADALEARTNAAFKAIAGRKPCVVMIRPDALEPACFLESDFAFLQFLAICVL